MTPLYEDNHIIIIHKECGEIVQGDKTGDTPLSESVKHWLKEKYAKPGNVFLGVVHRLDRPVAGIVVFAKTSKALKRLNDMFRKGEVSKTYWAIAQKAPEKQDETLINWLVRNEKQNKSYAYENEVPNSKKAILHYKVLGSSDHYTLLEINLQTGRHHQIRCQLAHMGCTIKGDLKYGARRSNPDGGISLLARRIEFVHPVSHDKIMVEAPLPNEKLWQEITPNDD
ncbi:RluA family pseudouridine synthase [Prevotella corporis]|uniref:RluA family pseudouridine synthase n=1 Tax=Prevotella corporis TaxID=28128 RepID=UPI002365F70D|nr:RNA pseudouridine synthase [Prevotella corporis]